MNSLRKVPFAHLVYHGPRRLSRRQKRHVKRNYLRLVNAVAARNFCEGDDVPRSVERAMWKHLRRAWVPVSFERLDR